MIDILGEQPAFIVPGEPEQHCHDCDHYYPIAGSGAGLCLGRGPVLMSTAAGWSCDRWTPCEPTVHVEHENEITVGEYFALRKAVGR